MYERRIEKLEEVLKEAQKIEAQAGLENMDAQSDENVSQGSKVRIFDQYTRAQGYTNGLLTAIEIMKGY